MQTYGVLAEINDKVFFEAIGGVSFEEVIKKIEKNKEKSSHNYDNTLIKQTQKIDFQDLVYINKISDGQFGGIYLVKDLNKNIRQ